jgi:universal stress protein E
MSTLKTILALVERTPASSAAVRRATELARRSGATLHLCAFDFHPMIDAAGDLVHPEVMRLARRQFLDERLHGLTELAVGIANRGIRVECDVVWAPQAHEALVAKALDIGADLIVKDLHQDAGIRRVVLRPADWKIVRFAPADLMLVQSQSHLLPQRIAAAVDTGLDSDEAQSLNERILGAALNLGLYADAPVQLAHVFPNTPLRPVTRQKLQSALARARRLDQERFRQFAETHRVPEDRRHWLEGDPVPTLIEFAEAPDSVDLLAVGSVYRSTLDRLFIGSTAETLLTWWPNDLLLVKPAGFAAELGSHLDLDTIRQRHGLAPRLPEAAVG